MKKIIAVILVLVMLLSLAACGKKADDGAQAGNTPAGNDTVADGGNQTNNPTGGDTDGEYAKTVFAPDRVKNTSGGVASVNNLSNSYYKLKNEKEFTIGYTGGSVTDGTGGTNGYCWRTAVTDWFKKTYPGVSIKEADGSQGNKSSLWGFFRIDDWTKSGQEASLIDMKPDLVFLEFAINDYYVRMSEYRTIHYMEGMINKIRTALPDADIVIIFITDEAYLGKEVPTTMAAQKELAAHYGIPTIDVGAAMNDHIKSTGATFNSLYMDNVHPNNAGYKVYADCITKYLTEKLITNHPNPTAVKNCEMPKNWLLSGGSINSELIPAEKFVETAKVTDGKILDAPGNAVTSFGPQLYCSTGSKIEFDMVGTGLALMIDAPTGSLLKCKIDGKETVSVQVMNKIHAELAVAENLTNGKHHMEIEIVSGKRFIIGAFLIEK